MSTATEYKSVNKVYKDWSPHHTSCQNLMIVPFPTLMDTKSENLSQLAQIPLHRLQPWGHNHHIPITQLLSIFSLNDTTPRLPLFNPISPYPFTQQSFMKVVILQNPNLQFTIGEHTYSNPLNEIYLEHGNLKVETHTLRHTLEPIDPHWPVYSSILHSLRLKLYAHF